jgi:GDSL-like Lipase/Acylhydrolase family
VRKLAFIPLLLLCVTPLSAATKKKVRKKSVHAKHAVRRHSPPKVHFSPMTQRIAFEAINERALHQASAMDGAAALVPFFEQISHPQEKGSVHILQYGDSHTASDDWAGMMREAFQQKFGAGGSGFTLAGHPFLGYRRFDIRGSNSRGWYTDGLVGRKGDGSYGLGGVSLTTQASGETVTVSTNCEQIELHYLQQPDGGSFEFAVDGVAVETIDSNGALEPGIYKYSPSAGSHEYTVRTLKRAPVRLLGWVAQNPSGITYETLGINGAQAGMLLDWNQGVLAGEIAAREPALIVLAYGTNEALSPKWTAEEYSATFTEVIHRLRAAAPLASILIVGPPDCEKRLRGGHYPFPHLDDVIQVQRRVALENGCAFWDWRTRMGGPGSVREWVQAGLGQGDFVHLTGAGYRLVGSMLFGELMAQYNRFLTVRAEGANGQ